MLSKSSCFFRKKESSQKCFLATTEFYTSVRIKDLSACFFKTTAELLVGHGLFLVTLIHTFKIGKKGYSGNYRAFRLTPVSGKVTRQTLQEAMSSHIKDKKAAASRQRGFTTGISCLPNLFAFCDEMAGSRTRTSQWMLKNAGETRPLTVSQSILAAKLGRPDEDDILVDKLSVLSRLLNTRKILMYCTESSWGPS